MRSEARMNINVSLHSLRIISPGAYSAQIPLCIAITRNQVFMMIHHLISQLFAFIAITKRRALCWIPTAFDARVRRTPQQTQQAQTAHEKTCQFKQERDQLAGRLEALQHLHEGRIRSFQHISHDLRNPLSFIIGPTAELLFAPNLSEIQKGQLQRILRNAQKVNRLIDDILEITRLAANEIPLKIQPIEATSCLSAIFKEYEMEAEKNNIAFQLEQRLPDSLVVHTDTEKLERILDNLLQNALKFTPQGGNITLELDTSPDVALIITVRDTGVGIAPEYLELVFEPLFRAPADKQTKGLGLGLAASRACARALGGDITAESTQNQGTTFQVRIPCLKSKQSPNPLIAPAFPLL